MNRIVEYTGTLYKYIYFFKPHIFMYEKVWYLYCEINDDSSVGLIRRIMFL